jgi:protein O-GlcNAc transferase
MSYHPVFRSLRRASRLVPKWVPFTRDILSKYLPRKLRRAFRQVLAKAKRSRDSLASSDLALAIMPASADTKLSITRLQETRAEAERMLATDPSNAAAWRRLGNALSSLKRYKQAISCYEEALAILPDNKAIWVERAAAVLAYRKNAAFFDIDEELAIDRRDASAWTRRAGFFSSMNRYGEAISASDQALAINPKQAVARRIGIRARTYACDWSRRGDDEKRISEGLRAGVQITRPFNHRTVSGSAAEQLMASRLFATGFLQPSIPLWRGGRYGHDRIRLAYLSPDFRESAIAILTAGVFEHHDRARFETIAISLGPDDKSKMRRRLSAAFEYFIDVRGMSDAAVAAMMRDKEVDIAIKINGYGGGARPGIVASRPAPVQVSFLDQGTSGAPYMDYMIADRTVVPSEQSRYYTEKIVYLPHSYLANDSRRSVPAPTPSRIQAGLPESGFVYCNFCNSNRISPAIFDVWMRLLNACPGSVLWLLRDNVYAEHNLRREALARNVAPERLIFAPRAPLSQHLARSRLADLFLDTLPFNGHTTASDALWAGLPIVTCLGDAFAGRVAASALCAIGLPELVTSSLTEYEDLALALAHRPERLAALRAKLLRNRDTEPLFDTARYTRHLESAYTIMWERQQAGLPPVSFSVAD